MISRLSKYFQSILHESRPLSYTGLFIGLGSAIFLVSVTWLNTGSLFFYVLGIGLIFLGLSRYITLQLNALVIGVLMLWVGSMQFFAMGDRFRVQNELSTSPTYWVYGVVSSLVKSSNRSDQYFFQTDSWSKQFSQNVLGREKKQLTLRVSDYKRSGLKVRLGDYLAIKMGLKPVHSTNEPDIFNYSTYLYSQSLDGLAYVKAYKKIEPVPTIWKGLYWFRQTISDHLSNFEHGGILQALTLGDRSRMKPSDQLLLQKTGLIHLFVISGLHIGLVFLFVYGMLCGLVFLVNKSYLGRMINTLLLVSLLVSFCYVLLSGMNIPAWRAWLMLFLYVLCRLFQTNTPSLFSLLNFSACVMLLVKPTVLFSTSFWLSYCAVLGIVLFLKMCRFHQIGGQISVRSMLWGVFGVSIFLSIWLLPLFLHLGIKQGVFSGFFNAVLVLPFGYTVVPLTLLGLLTFGLGMQSIAAWCWQVINDLMGVLMSFLASVEGLFWPLWSVEIGWTLFIFLSTCLSLVAVFFNRRFVRYLAILGFVVGLFVAHFRMRPNEGAVDFHIMDIGHGLSILIETKNHHLLFDTGYPHHTHFVVLPKLKRLGVKRLDAFVASHADRDHAGGINLVGTSFDVVKKYEGQAGLLENGKLCQNADPWVWDGVYFEFVYPWEGLTFKNNNAHSCVLMVRTGVKTFLIAADIGFKEEALLVNKRKDVQADVMIVPHQGSRYSSGKKWLAHHKKLEHAIFVHARFNGYGHPARSVVDRYRSHNVKNYSTGCFGGVYVQMQSAHIIVKQAKLWPWQTMGLPKVCNKMQPIF